MTLICPLPFASYSTRCRLLKRKKAVVYQVFSGRRSDSRTYACSCERLVVVERRRIRLLLGPMSGALGRQTGALSYGTSGVQGGLVKRILQGFTAKMQTDISSGMTSMKNAELINIFVGHMDMVRACAAVGWGFVSAAFFYSIVSYGSLVCGSIVDAWR